MNLINQHKVAPSVEASDALAVVKSLVATKKPVYLDPCNKVPNLVYAGSPEDQRIKMTCTALNDHKVGRIFNKLPGGYYGPGKNGVTIATLIVAADANEKTIKSTVKKKVVKLDPERQALDMRMCAFALKQAGGSFVRLKRAYNANGGSVGKVQSLARIHAGFSDRYIPTSYRDFVTAVYQGTIKV